MIKCCIFIPTHKVQHLYCPIIRLHIMCWMSCGVCCVRSLSALCQQSVSSLSAVCQQFVILLCVGMSYAACRICSTCDQVLHIYPKTQSVTSILSYYEATHCVFGCHVVCAVSEVCQQSGKSGKETLLTLCSRQRLVACLLAWPIMEVDSLFGWDTGLSRFAQTSGWDKERKLVSPFWKGQ